jgi:hypothetical protein
MPNISVKVEVEVEVEVWCSCGEGLCGQSEPHQYGRGVVVEPCKKCLDAARENGYDQGYEQCLDDNKP